MKKLLLLLLLASCSSKTKVSKAIVMYVIPSGSNYPGLCIGDSVFASSLLTPERYDIISFRAKDGIRMQRICGMEGDVVEMKNGDLYVNGRYADSSLRLAHRYICRDIDVSVLTELVGEDNVLYANGNMILANVADELIKSGEVEGARAPALIGEPDSVIQAVYQSAWNADHFGPVTVPKGKYFLLGDNRSNSLDSRYLGFANVGDRIATMLK